MSTLDHQLNLPDQNQELQHNHSGSSLEDVDGMQVGSMLLDMRNSSKKLNRNANSSSHARLTANKFGLNKTINVKCKDMKSYDLAFSADSTQMAPMTPMAVLYCEPERLPGGATLPTALFRDP